MIGAFDIVSDQPGAVQEFELFLQAPAAVRQQPPLLVVEPDGKYKVTVEAVDLAAEATEAL